MRHARTYATPDGEPRFEDAAAVLIPGSSLPGSPPADLSAALATTSAIMGRFPPGWYWDWHPSPWRQRLFTMAGAAEVETSDGNKCRLEVGSLWLHEDTFGKGRSTRAVGDAAWLAVVVVLAD